MDLTQRDVDSGCEAIRQHYLRIPQKSARLEFAYDLQGFIASEIDRGLSVGEACAKVVELIQCFMDVNKAG